MNECAITHSLTHSAMKTLALLILASVSCTSLILLTHTLEFDKTSYDVRVINGFSNNSSEPLVVWCVSHEGHDTGDDIGGRALQERDDYSWTVKTGVFDWSLSRFVCTVKWEGRRKKFEAFEASRYRKQCGVRRQCIWLVREDGFYFGNDGLNWVRLFLWT